MTFEFHSADASYIYRQTSASSSTRFDGTANTGALFELMKNTVVAFGNPDPRTIDEAQIPLTVIGDVKATFRRR